MPGQEDEVNEKQIRARYTLEFKQEAVRQVKDGRAAAVVARTLGMPKAGLTNWLRPDAKGQLAHTSDSVKVVSATVVTPEQTEIARLRAEVARLKMERDIAKKAAAYFAQDVLQSTLGSGR
jgi:transposase